MLFALTRGRKHIILITLARTQNAKKGMVKNMKHIPYDCIAISEFNEGMATVQEVMQAQTAWIKAHSSLIDAKIDIMLSQARLRRATGTLE